MTSFSYPKQECKIYVPAQSLDDWTRLHPPEHWKEGKSAKNLAECWQHATKKHQESFGGFPLKVREVLCHHKAFCNTFGLFSLELLAAFPEYKCDLEDGQPRLSHNDIFVLARDEKGLTVIMVEGKVNETFEEKVCDKKRNLKRIDGLRANLEISPNTNINHIRYQLLHRTVSAILTAKKFHAKTAVMLIHSFASGSTTDTQNWNDFKEFAELLSNQVPAPDNVIYSKTLSTGIDLYLGWVDG